MEEPYTFINNTVTNGPSIKVLIGTDNENDAKCFRSFFSTDEIILAMFYGRSFSPKRIFSKDEFFKHRGEASLWSGNFF